MNLKVHISPKLWEKLKPIAREMRHEPTLAEDALWQAVRDHKIKGAKFRRQHSVGPFIVDFYCSKAKLVIEVDGSIHQYTQEEDAVRQEFLESMGLQVIRFSNEDVLNNLNNVIDQVASALPESDQLSASNTDSDSP